MQEYKVNMIDKEEKRAYRRSVSECKGVDFVAAVRASKGTKIPS